MTISIRQDGTDVTARMPSLRELNGVLEAPRSPLAYKALAKACILVPTYGELAKRKPACGPALGMVVIQASGLLADVLEMDEADIPAEVAEAIVALEGKGFVDLQAVKAEVGGVSHVFVQRMAREPEVDAYLKSETAEAAKTLVETITTYPTKEMGGVVALQQDAPGLYVALAKYALRRAGLVDDIVLGEA